MNNKINQVIQWKVPRRIIYISVGIRSDISIITSKIIEHLWDEGGTGIALNIVTDDHLTTSLEKITSQRNDVVQLRASIKKDIAAQKENPIKDLIATVLRIFKPSIIVVDASAEYALVALREADQVGVPIVINDSPNSSATKYFTESPKFKGRVSSYANENVNNERNIANICKKLIDGENESEEDFREQNELRVAAIMDTFSYLSYAPECNLLQLVPENIIDDLSNFCPDLLFVESAWKGKNDLWDRKIANPVHELKSAIDWCKARLVPTVFWNKEDPVHFETFITVASMFDYVFTTDLDCVGKYKERLGHDRIFLLPFACQPKNHNPIEIYDRKDAFCFAGAYYKKYPQRIKDLESFVEELTKFKALDIYDRNYEKKDSNYQFPELYKPYILGTLPFDQIDKAYKGYKYSINLNSIKQSQTMFARRVFELLGSNTLTVSNFSRGVKLLFGDLTICSDSGKEIIRKVKASFFEEAYDDKLRLNAVRKIMLEHTYSVRLQHVISKTLPNKFKNKLLPNVLVFGLVSNSMEIEKLKKVFNNQTYRNKKLLLIKSNDFIGNFNDNNLSKDYVYINYKYFFKNNHLSIFSKCEWVAYINKKDYYGINYLTDLILATKYSTCDVIGKNCFYRLEKTKCYLVGSGKSYRYSEEFNLSSSLISARHLSEIGIEAYLDKITDGKRYKRYGLSIDQFNYCEDAGFANEELFIHKVIDIPIDVGISIDDLNKLADTVPPSIFSMKSENRCSADVLAKLFNTIKSNKIRTHLDEAGLCINSDLSDGMHEYVYANKVFDRDNFSGDIVNCYIETTPGLNLQFVLRFLDSGKNVISYKLFPSNNNLSFEIPDSCTYVLLGVRIYQSGEAFIKGIDWSHRDVVPSVLMGADILLITNQYPSYENLYKNGFVHTRALEYKKNNLSIDVFTPGDSEMYFREYEGVNVIEGSENCLKSLVGSGAYKKIFIHFLTPNIWSVLREYADNIPITIWLHGSDIQSYHHRIFLYETPDQINTAQKISSIRNLFWKEILERKYEKMKFIFVSNYLSRIVQSDLDFSINKSNVAVIHNGINVDHYRYKTKKIEDRLKILSIRPYASKVYANDLTVQAILELSQKSFFDELIFTLIGDGDLFDETIAPIKHFTNVVLIKKFLDSREIVSMHEAHGIFLCPTRMDTQGVSRDEAMASGLVPVTNDVAAISEFVDSSNGFAVEPESATQLAQSIEFLYKNPEAFIRLSVESACSVRQSRSLKITTYQELNFIDASFLGVKNG